MKNASQHPSEQARDPQPIVVAMGADENFVMPLAVAIFSIAVNLEPDDQVTIYLIDGGITQHSREKLTKCVGRFADKLTLTWLEPDLNQLWGLKGIEHLSTAAYLRLLLPDLLPSDVEKIIYLDCDLLVRNSLRALWNVDMDEAPLLAARDQYIKMLSNVLGLPETYQTLGLASDSPYFNSGVMVLNVRKWREQKISALVIDYLRANSMFLRWADQDGLNAILSARVSLLDARWNYQYGGVVSEDFSNRRAEMAFRAKCLGESFIVHYTSRNKPWITGPLDPERVEFLRYLWLSRWYGLFPYLRMVVQSFRCHVDRCYLWPAKGALKKLLRFKR